VGSLRVERCKPHGHCEIALQAGDSRYHQHGVRSPCSLADEEIIAAQDAAGQCEQPLLPCTSAADCP
jgi:hypothetical protein